MVYEVRIAVDPSIREEWLAWIGPHIEKVLLTECFSCAHLEQEIHPVDERPAFRVRYHYNTAADLDRYHVEFAPALRAEGVERFGTAMTASRSTLELLTLREVQPGS